MALADMIGEISGSLARVDDAFAKTLLNESWQDVRRLGGWSWQLGETGFTVPGALETGTVTLQFGIATVTGDANATAAWATASQYESLLSQRQFRAGGTMGAGTMYDIVAYSVVGGFGQLTLNRPFTDPLTSLTAPVALQEYAIYQPYIVAPCSDFRRWLTVFDMGNAGWLRVRADRRAIPGPGADPQRQIFGNPDRLLALGSDQRANSSTKGWQRYELWPGPESQFLYQAWFTRFGVDLVALTDTLPDGIPESMVKAKARGRMYEWAEANKDKSMPRGSGADFRFLKGEADAQYKRELKQARLEDRDKVDIFITTMKRFAEAYPPATWNQQTGTGRAMVGV